MPELRNVREPGGLEPQVADPANDARPPRSESERSAVRHQLERILASQPFRNSKRYSSFLQYIVEQTLEGRAGHVKERAIGTDVFERKPDYDTNLDHVVRSAAGEVRRRLAQYYQDSTRDSEIRIDIRPGSYVPQFRFPCEKAIEVTAPGPGATPALATAEPPRKSRISRRWLAALSIGAVSALVALAVALSFPARSQTALDRFWAPVAGGSAPILLCVGDDPQVSLERPSGGGQAPGVGDLRFMTHQRIFAEDAVALARLSGVLVGRGHPINVRTQRSTTFNDLKEGPVVLIGAFNNEWTLRLVGTLRFRFGQREGSGVIIDGQNPSQVWSPQGDLTRDYAVTRDYAIVSRFRDSQTGQLVVVAAGIMGYGTVAAGELLTNAELMKSLEADAPRWWEQKNVQVVLSTDIFKGAAGPAKIVARHFW